MNVLSLDLELNKDGDQITDICQIGAVVGDLQTGEILEEFSQLIKTSKPLDPFIIKLCGISQEEMDRDAIGLEYGYHKLCDLANRYKVFSSPLTWGGGDSECLRSQLGIDHKDFLFGRRWLDIKSIYQVKRMCEGLDPRAGLSKALHRSGLVFSGRSHQALADSRNTFRIACHLFKGEVYVK